MPVIEDLNHPELRVRIETSQAFMQAGSAAVPTLIGAFEHPDPEIRWRAAATAGWIGAAEALPALVSLCRTPLYETQFNCVWALGQIGDDSVIPYLLEILHGDETESPDIRYNAALALARLGRSDTLQEALKDSDHPTHRVAHAALGAARYF